MQLSTGNFGYKVKRDAFGLSSFLSLFIFGLVFAGAGIFIMRSAAVDKSWTLTQGKVTGASSHISDGSKMYTAVVSYTVDGRTYQTTDGYSSGTYPSIGSTREVGYNPERPDQAKVKQGLGGNLFILIFPAIGSGLMLLSPYLYYKSRKRTKQIEHLMQHGHKLQGIMIGFDDTTHNKNSYKIVVAATDTGGSVQNYVSDPLKGVAGITMADFQNNPIPIDVFVDQTDPSNYYVDISDIPNLTSDRISELIQRAVSKQSSAAPGQNPPPFNPTTTIPSPVPVQPPAYNGDGTSPRQH